MVAHSASPSVESLDKSQQPEWDSSPLSTLPPVDGDLEAAMDPPTTLSTKSLSSESSPTALAHSSPTPRQSPLTLTLDRANVDEKRASLVKGDTESASSVIEQKEDDIRFFVDRLDTHENPKNLVMWRKVIIMWTMCMGALCSTAASSLAAFAEAGEQRDFHISKEVSILGVSMYVLGNAVGPLLVGPLSEVYGRNIIYRVSYAVFFAFSFPIAFTHHVSVFMIFRFLTGFVSSTFLSVAGGTVSDIFSPRQTSVAIAVYILSPFIGPMVGPLVSGFINQNTDWRWTYRVLIIWVFVVCVMIFLCVPETYEPVLLKWKAAKLRKNSGDNRYYSALDRRHESMTKAVLVSCYMPFELLLRDRMHLLLDLWTALNFGILYLAFQAFPFIFERNHGFSIQSVGLSFIGIGIGMTAGCITNILIINHTEEHAKNGVVLPEQRLRAAMPGAIIVPLSLYFLAFTTYPSVHWVVPIIASGFFGLGFLMCVSSTFTYLVAAYRPIAASSVSANAFVRSFFAAAFPLFAGQMYQTLGTVGATALLAGIMTISAPLPFIFSRIGARLRAKSQYGSH